MIKVEFTENFANKKEGDISSYDGMLASQLINKLKVAKLYTEPKEIEVKEPKIVKAKKNKK